MAKKKAPDHGPGAMDNGLRPDLKTLADELRKRTDERDAIASERGRISNQLKQADEAVGHAVAAIVAASRPGQLPLIPEVVATKVDDDIDDDEPETGFDGNGGEFVVSGTTGAPLAAVPSTANDGYLMEPSTENPALCECGWEIASPIPGHDRRHEQYLRSIEPDATADDAAPAKRVYREKSPGAKRKTAAKKPRAKKKAARA